MSTPEPPTHEDDVELLLPWYATGRLPPADAERVRRALAADGELRRRLELVREEQAETIRLTEAIAAPSVRARDALFARIDAAQAQAAPAARPAAAQAAGRSLAGRLAQLMSALSPRTLAWSAAAVAAVLVLQAGVIGKLLVDERMGTYTTASGPAGREASGAYALVAFAPDATAAAITAFLAASKAAIVDGPKPGGIYRVRIADKPLARDEMDARLAGLRRESRLVRLALPEPAAP